jgi:hypothetical protein
LLLGRAGFTADLDIPQRLLGRGEIAHQIADAFVGGEVIIDAAIGGVADARLLRAVAPMLDAVARAQADKAAEMVDVDFAGMPRHRLGEPPALRIARAERGVPQPQIGREFAVRPGEAANVVFPLVPVAVVAVHHIAMIPESVPAAPIDFAVVEIDEIGELVLDQRALGSRTIG